MVDKNLFRYDLAVVAIMKCEAPYLKEWLDYHLAAGVDHFYIYDNDSPDNQAEVAAPYVEAGLVDYILAPGRFMLMRTFNDAVKRFKFQCRYMAFIDGDEFIYPKNRGGASSAIMDVVDEILSHYPNAAALAINWQMFGSNGQETADYSRGVLERFTRRAPSDWAPEGMGNAHVKTIANPRAINFMSIPHFAFYFEGTNAVNENGGNVPGAFNNPVTAEKIVINHYHTKSREEFAKKVQRGAADHYQYQMKSFAEYDRNDVFDDGILHYRDARAKIYRPPDNSHTDERLLNALAENLLPTMLPNTPQDFYRGKLETFLTCRAVAADLQTRLTDATAVKFFEEAALKAILLSFNGASIADVRLFIRELPSLLNLPYPAVKDLRKAALQIIPQAMNIFQIQMMWERFYELEHILDLLKLTNPTDLTEPTDH